MAKSIRKKIQEQVKAFGMFNGTFRPLPNEIPVTLEDRVKKLLNETLKGHADPVLVEIIRKQIKKALAGDRQAAELLMDRAYGKVTQNVSVSQPPTINIQHNVISLDQIKELNKANEDHKE